VVDLRPFRGWRYNSEKIPAVEDVVAPPFDVIREPRRQELIESSPHNVVRLTLAGGLGGTWHQEAAERFRQWKEEGILHRDLDPSFYAYETHFDWNGEKIRRRGLIGILRLEEDEQEVYPHEHTFAAPRADRLKLLAACRANLEPIFLLFPDADMVVDKTLAESPRLEEVEIPSFDEVAIRFWRVGDPGSIQTIRKHLAGRKLLIADGHHRFATAKDFRDAEWERVGERDREAGYNFRLVNLATIEDPALRILPTHRTVRRLPEEKLEGLLEKIGEFYEVRKAEGDIEDLAKPLRDNAEGAPEMGVALREGLWSLFPRDEAAIRKAIGEDHSPLWSSLPASRLHGLILHGILEIGQDEFPETVDFYRSPSEAVSEVTEGRARAAFLLRAISPETVWELSKSAEMMPQKSTDFYPKLPSGFVVYGFD
jgi:uncharacterized protein (DUF1015 family)